MTTQIMKAADRLRGRALVLAVALALAGGAAAQAPQPAAKPAAAPAPSAKKPAGKKAPEVELVREQRAMDLLKATSARLAAAKTMSFTATASIEYPSRLGPPILYTSRYNVTMQRPDKLRILMPGDGPASEFYYDGKTMMAYAPAEDLVAVADAPPTIDGVLKAAYDRAGMYFPFTDLLVADPYKALTDGVILAFYIGPSGFVGGTKTEMLAWANNDVFLQIWIGVDDKLPRRVRAVYRADPMWLRNDLELTDWQLDGAIAPTAFGSNSAQSAKRIAFAKPAAPPKAGISALGKTPPKSK